MLRTNVVFTPPFPHSGGGAAAAAAEDEEKPKSPGSCKKMKILELVRSIMPGSDITRFQVPVQFNVPKSYLQCYGESVYCCAQDLLAACSRAPTPLQRFLRVVAWILSTLRLSPFGLSPLNPTLGETHHVSFRHVNLLLEQVSHHPPVSALYATDDENDIRLQWTRRVHPHFYGNKMEAEVRGASILWLDSHNEMYTYTFPSILLRFFPAPGCEHVSTSTIRCVASGLEATISFKRKTCFGLKGNAGQIAGEVKDMHSNAVVCEISGFWNRVVMQKNAKTGEESVLFDSIAAMSNMKMPTFRNDKDDIEPTETLGVWKGVMAGITRRDWEMARRAKHEVEERQRVLAKQRKAQGIAWTPKHFVEAEEDGQWQWKHSSRRVPQAPILVPS